MTITQSFTDGESVASDELYDDIDPRNGRQRRYQALDTFTATKTVVIRQ